MAVEGVEDRLHVRRAVGQVAVVVVGRQVVEVAAVGVAAVAAVGAGVAVVPGADQGGAAEGQAGGDLAGVVEADPVDRLQVAVPDVPHRLGVDRALAVDAVAAGAAGAGTGVDDEVDAVRHARLAVRPVDVADAGAGGQRAGRVDAGIAVAAAGRAGEEVVADARGVQAQRGVDVGDALARARDAGVGVEGVEVVAPLVVEHAGQLAGVRAAAARPEEVDAAGAAGGVALVVDVHRRRELAARRGVAGEVAARHLLEAVQLVEAGAGGVGVAGRVAAGGDRAVGAARGAEGEEVAGGALVDRAAVVDHVEERPGQRRADGAVDAGLEVAAGVGEEGLGAHRQVGVREGIDHLRAARGDAVVGDREDAAVDPAGGGVVRLVLEREQLAVEGVDQTLPLGREVVGEVGADHPGQPVGQALARRHQGGVAAARGHRHVLEDQLAAAAARGERCGVAADQVLGLVGGHHRHRRQRDVGPVVGAEQDQVAAADHRGQVAVADRNAADLARCVDLDVGVAVVDGDVAGLAQLGGIDPQRAGVARDPAVEGVPGGLLALAGGRRFAEAEVAPAEGVGAAGQERLDREQGAPAAGAVVDPRVVGGDAQAREVLRGARGHGRRQLGRVPVEMADVEIGVPERLVGQGGRVRLPEGQHGTGDRQHERRHQEQLGEGEGSTRHESLSLWSAGARSPRARYTNPAVLTPCEGRHRVGRTNGAPSVGQMGVPLG